MDTGSRFDPVERIYDARIRGACLISTRAGRRLHLHGGCWVAPCAREPARFLVAFPAEFEGADLVRRGGAFAVSLVADDQWDLHERIFAGYDSLDTLGRDGFLRAPSGCPVLRDGVGYLDCVLTETVDLGDFLVAVGDLRAGAVLHPDKRNLTVNAILRRRAPTNAVLPLQGFDDAGEALAAAPDEGASAAVLDRVYAHRFWGLFLIAARADGHDHVHVGSWAIQCSHRPPRMLVCVDRRLPAADMIRASGAFALSLPAEDQLPVATAVARGASEPLQVPSAAWSRYDGGPPVLADGVGHFVCGVEGEFDAGADFAGFYGPVRRYAAGRRDAAQLREDQLVAALRGGIA